MPSEMKIDTQYTAEQLAKIGRAMERCNIATIADFVALATLEKADKILSATPANATES